jgi:hypothetical protein
MPIPQTKIVNAETGEEVIRDMNTDELAQLEIDKASAQAEADAVLAKETAKAALLKRLGLTVDEAALLLG